METITMVRTGEYYLFRINPEAVKGWKKCFDIRKVAYELARAMLANGCLIGSGELRVGNADAYEYRVYVGYLKKADADMFNSPILEKEWKR